MENLYHIHRYNNKSNSKSIGDTLKINDDYNSTLYKNILIEEEILIKRYNNYDIDYIICMMEEIKSKYVLPEEKLKNFNRLLRDYYIIRREKALEEGRKIFNPNAPSRLHSLYLTDKKSLNYWKKVFKDFTYKIFLLELDGNLFVSSDDFFPDNNLALDFQVDESKKYWVPNIKRHTLKKEYIFQGTCTILDIK